MYSGEQSTDGYRLSLKNAFKDFCASKDLKDTLHKFNKLIVSMQFKRNASQDNPTFTVELQKKLKFDSRAKQFFETIWKERANTYMKLDKHGDLIVANNMCQERKVLVLGGGPSGLRMAIEAKLSGAHVVVIERRQTFGRRNIIYLWDYVVNDMKSLGCKTFYGDFCSGSRQIIAIQKLQIILLKIALLLGVEFYSNVTMKYLQKPHPSGNCGWKAIVIPSDHPVSGFEFDFFVDATGVLGPRVSDTPFMFDNPMGDGYLNHQVKALSGLKKGSRTFIAVAANFEMDPSKDMKIKDFGGISRVCKDNKSNLDLSEFVDENGENFEIENLTYYKGDTHYFLMTISEKSLLQKNILKVAVSDISKATNPENVNFVLLELAVRRIVEQATKGKLKDRQLCLLRPGKKDLTVFGYVAQVFASASCRVLDRNGKRLFMALVGDSLIKPHWPSGNGIVKGFFSAMDTCNLMQQWSPKLSKTEIQELLKEKEKHFCCLKSINAGKHINNRQTYTGTDPKKRYTDLSERILPYLGKLYDTDSFSYDSSITNVIESNEIMRSCHTEEHEQLQIPLDLVLFWYTSRLKRLDIEVTDFTTSWRSGLALWGLISMCEEEYLNMNEFNENDPVANNEKAVNILSNFFGVTPTLSAQEISTCSNKNEAAMVEFLVSVFQRIKRMYEEVDPVEQLLPCTGAVQNKESGDLIRSEISSESRPNMHLTGYKWKDHKESLSRSGSLPSIVPGIKTGEECPVCSKEILCHEFCLHQLGHSVHVNCFKCDACNFRLSGMKFVFSDISRKYYCFKHHQSKEPPTMKGKLPKSADSEDVIYCQIRQKDDEKESVSKMFGDREEKDEKPSTTFADKNHSSILKEYRRRTTMTLPITTIREESPGLEKRNSNSPHYPEKCSWSGGAKRSVESIKKQLKALMSPDVLKVIPKEQPLHKTVSCPQLSKKSESVNCHYCSKRVYWMERTTACKQIFHRYCFKCEECGTQLTMKTFIYEKKSSRFLCLTHSSKPADAKKSFVPKMVETLDAQSKPNSKENSTPKLAKMARRISTIFHMKLDRADAKIVTKL